MARVPIYNLADWGMVVDKPGHQLDPEAWTFAENIRFADDAVLKLPGRSQVFGTPGVAPSFAIPLIGPSSNWWIYTSLTKAYVYDGSDHTDITRTAGDYSASNAREWQGTILGGIPIINNGVDDPQFWNSYSKATPLADLTNWPANTTCKVIKAFNQYLIAFNVSESGTSYPHRIKWSHQADPGSLPTSWDETDSTIDAGEFDLADVESGHLQDMLILGSQMIIYKENATWVGRFIGGRFIFDFDPLFAETGILATRCVSPAMKGRRHMVVTQDDVIVHNGSEPESILDAKYRRTLFRAIDTTNYKNSFTFHNPLEKEVWFCFPENGNTTPNRAMIWNYGERSKTLGPISEAEIDFSWAVAGSIESPSENTWTTSTGTWDEDPDPWSELSRRRVVACVPGQTKFAQLDSGVSNLGSTYTGTLQRTGLAVIGRRQDNTPIVDIQRYKLITRVWINASGGVFRVRVGAQDTPEGDITWAAYADFDPSTDDYVDFNLSGKFMAIEFNHNTDAAPFRIEGYELDIHPLGQF